MHKWQLHIINIEYYLQKQFAQVKEDIKINLQNVLLVNIGKLLRIN
jgi:hypothetical protein